MPPTERKLIDILAICWAVGGVVAPSNSTEPEMPAPTMTRTSGRQIVVPYRQSISASTKRVASFGRAPLSRCERAPSSRCRW
ncbi:MAG: hypothetical protein IPL75_09240 [Acidobacteria bacterium]|nr:hypothetical protein [Acidobacteriota bacterium]